MQTFSHNLRCLPCNFIPPLLRGEKTVRKVFLCFNFNIAYIPYCGGTVCVQIYYFTVASRCIVERRVGNRKMTFDKQSSGILFSWQLTFQQLINSLATTSYCRLECVDNESS